MGAAIGHALAEQVPVVGLWDSGGAHLAQGVGSLHAVGSVFAAMLAAFGKIPQISVVRRGMPATLLMIGDGPERGRAEAQVRAAGAAVPVDEAAPRPANNPVRMGGCLDARSAEKAARFVRMCNAFGVP